MNAMITDLAESIRIESGQIELDIQAVGLVDFVAELVHRSSGTMDTARIRVEMPEQLPMVWADPNRLERILVNLLSNALKYSEEDSEVLVRGEAGEKEVRVSVEDRGPGVVTEEIPRLFERFYRSQNTKRSEGLGLGLYITRMLVESHGGRLWAESALGQGSAFHFTLPQAD